MMNNALGVICAILVDGCATICSRIDYSISIDCNEPDAHVDIYRHNEFIETVTAPTNIVLSARGGFYRPETYKFEFYKAGFTIDTQELTASLDYWWFGNVPIGATSPISLLCVLLVDPLTGAMWKFDETSAVKGNIRRFCETNRKLEGGK